ncbi:formate dehydrogenase accessory sulfurtransferase FdhD [Polaromonas sp.]|uniref:formate dehydrogenase accessory sulfurtransferase FdhD n=1 Tax=Polaromonas sp. TaxID=1869339 RepID=UPI0025F9C23D|nr:formate dehydrogenase accessory sulfurtransferase FdhD [Polaromonas sp.]
MPLPHLTLAQAPLTCEIDAVNEYGEHLRVSIPAERALTLYVDKRELVTLMTLGAHPELLVLGYLRNQRLVTSIDDIESITVDWEVGAAAVKTRHGIEDIVEKTSRRIVTTGCGQGSVFGGLMDEVDQIALPPNAGITQSQLYALVNTIRLKETTYKSAGSVHACALFDTTSAEPEMLLFVEDVGRHNAIDTIAGWMWMQEIAPTLPTACGSLSPERAVPPKGGLSAELAPALVASRAALPPEGAELRLGRPGASFVSPTLATSCAALPAEEAGLAQGGPSLRSMAPAPDATDAVSPTSTTAGLAFYTTGRLTSEMVIKSAQMGVPIVVSRSGITQMGHQVAQAVGLCAIGRATNKRFVCYSNPQRLQLQPGLVIKPEIKDESRAELKAEQSA